MLSGEYCIVEAKTDDAYVLQHAEPTYHILPALGITPFSKSFQDIRFADQSEKPANKFV